MMHMKKTICLGIGTLLLVSACSNQDEPRQEQIRKLNQKGEYIYRLDHEYLFTAEAPKPKPAEPYPWEAGVNYPYLKLTKEFFRCKGSPLNPSRVVQQPGKEPLRFHDCGGAEKHSLPLRNQKEFIYPILIDLLNYIQAKTGKKVVITCGHRCPDHNSYADPSPENQYSKHLIGASASFYVQGLENQPETILKWIFDYYKQTPKYKGLKEYQEFTRYDKGDLNVSTAPWMNKEIFVKLFKKNEGRDFDNRHPYPYFDIQVRYDWDLQEPVQYSWDKAQRNFLRW